MGRGVGLGSFGDVLREMDRRLRAVERGRSRVPVLTSDPVPVMAGDVWVRADVGQLCWHDGTTVRRISGS